LDTNLVGWGRYATKVAQRNGTDVMTTWAGRQLAGYLLGIVARHPEAQARVDAMEEKE